MANAFFSFGLVGLHLARVVCSCGLVALNFNVGFIFNVGQVIVCFWIGWRTFRYTMFYFPLGRSHLAFVFSKKKKQLWASA